jgi:hypothetical protein
MEELLYREEMMWLQWSRSSWLKEGDHNTKFFHRKAAGRGKKNRIDLLMKEDRVITKDRHKMEGMTNRFFSRLVYDLRKCLARAIATTFPADSY